MFNEIKDAGAYWNLIKKANNQNIKTKIGPLKRDDGTLALINKDKADLFNFYFSRIGENLCICWEDGCLPQDLKDTRIVHLYKGKGDKSSCDNYRGISLLSIAGKILCKVILNRLNTDLLDEIVPESQCGFRKNRGTGDLIFCARQIQEKCKEQNKDLYILFVNLTKAFNTVSRPGLWRILPQIGIPPQDGADNTLFP